MCINRFVRATLNSDPHKLELTDIEHFSDLKTNSKLMFVVHFLVQHRPSCFEMCSNSGYEKSFDAKFYKIIILPHLNPF